MGKRASKFKFTASYQELSITFTNKWYEPICFVFNSTQSAAVLGTVRICGYSKLGLCPGKGLGSGLALGLWLELGLGLENQHFL